MKKIIIFLVIITIIISGISYMFLKYKAGYEIARKENFQYESYYNKEILGSELATIINKAIDNNIKNEVPKNNKGIYIDNNENSIKIDIKFTDDDNIYKMETIYSNKIEKFILYYGEIKFKCIKIEYHKTTYKIKYMLFEQIEVE